MCKSTEISSQAKFEKFFAEIAVELKEQGYTLYHDEVLANLSAYEVPMTGYYERIATLAKKIIRDETIEISPPLQQKLEFGFELSVRLVIG